jgi:hypothetical protein
MHLNKFLLFFILPLASFSANDRGEISGTVFDPQGVARPESPVQAKSVKTGEVFRATSGPKGEYAIQGLAPGAYDVSANVGGLQGFQKKGVIVEMAKTVRVDVKFTEGSQLSTLGADPITVAADQKRHRPPSGPTPRTADGKPDLTGVWWRPVVTDPGTPEWLPEADALAKARNESNMKDSPQANCLPSAAVRLGPLWEIVQSKNFMVIISDDDYPGFHQVYLDDRQHPKDPNPAWYGHNIARWDGDTLVIDRVGFDERVYTDEGGHPHSDKLHIIERYRRPDMGHIEAEVTVEDPGVLKRPYTLKRVSDLAQEEISEFICNENNRDTSHMVGK